MEKQEANDTKNQGNPVIQRVYLKIFGHLDSPLLIGSGENAETDMDVLLNSVGQPFLPGTSLAGTLKQGVTLLGGKDAAERLFGKLQCANVPGRQSQTFVYDAKLENANISTRDGVRLNEYKTAVDQAKYELQMVNAKTKFTIFVEVVQRIGDTNFEDDLKILYEAFALLHSGEIRLGAKKNRGFGKVSLYLIKEKVFHMDRQEERNFWLNWEMRADAFADTESIDFEKIDVREKLEHCLRVPLAVKQTLMIRRYADLLSETADYSQLKEGTEVVIPGSTWMGAIRAHIAKIMRHICNAKSYDDCQIRLSEFFGACADAKGNQTARKASLVKVEESIVRGSTLIPMTRTAIDRFTGGVIQGALYTAEVAVHGETELVLRWSTKSIPPETSDVICGLLLWAIRDLQDGLLAVGGETAVGRGVFKACKDSIRMDGQELTGQNKYSRAAVDWCKGAAVSDEQRFSD